MECHNGVIVTTLTNLPTPKLVDIVGSLMEEEKKLKRQGLVYREAYFTKNTSKGSTSKNFSKDKFKCNFYGKPGHFEKDCFIKKKDSANMIQENIEEEGNQLMEMLLYMKKLLRYQSLPLIYILGDYHLCHHLVLGILVA